MNNKRNVHCMVRFLKVTMNCPSLPLTAKTNLFLTLFTVRTESTRLTHIRWQPFTFVDVLFPNNKIILLAQTLFSAQPGFLFSSAIEKKTTHCRLLLKSLLFSRSPFSWPKPPLLWKLPAGGAGTIWLGLGSSTRLSDLDKWGQSFSAFPVRVPKCLGREPLLVGPFPSVARGFPLYRWHRLLQAQTDVHLDKMGWVNPWVVKFEVNQYLYMLEYALETGISVLSQSKSLSAPKGSLATVLRTDFSWISRVHFPSLT